MFYPGSAVERAMRIQEVVMRAVTGQIQWLQAVEILGVSCHPGPRNPVSTRRPDYLGAAWFLPSHTAPQNRQGRA